ncbi:MAG: ATP-dependent helicase [Alkaliphilus sp.]|nr:DEAD/DEAH box helicase [bacterium AH-315-L21]MBN4056618.1 DEAD/DEAH box helicase [bacterium AH-315-K05]PHS34784.1 MAG: ATP-dependent helicase [Alkaliphilus sp.]
MKDTHESVEMKNKQLIAILHPNGLFEIDFQEKQETVTEEQNILQDELYKRFRENPDEAMLFLGISSSRVAISASFNYIRSIAVSYINKLSNQYTIELSRDKVEANIDKEEIKSLLENAPYLIGSEYLNNEWIKIIWSNLHKTFCKMIKEYSGTVEEFFNSYNSNVHLAGRIFFHLVESKNEEFPFAFLATYTAYISTDGIEKHLPLKNALIEYEGDSQRLLELLSTVNKACKQSVFISEIVDTGDIFHPIRLDQEEAYTFLKEIPVYEEAGILCRIPNWWKSKSNSLKISVTVGNNLPSRIGLDALVDFNVQLHLGGVKIDANELKKLISEAEGLAFIKGKWVEVNHKKLKEILKAYEKAQALKNNNDMSMLDAMRFQLNAEKNLNISAEICEIEVTNGEWINSVVGKLTRPDLIEQVSCGKDFNAELRPYQEKGLSWLSFMKSLGLGACLADDMGLGKTIQVIALLNNCKDKKREKSLIIVPVSLIGNWMSEIDKFAPTLKYCILHPSENKNLSDDKSIYENDFDLYITSYGMLAKQEWIKDVKWDSIILDEAQAIKNPRTKRTRAVKELKSKYRIAMTGTPIENRLSDLWSLFDFLNMGLLGTTKEFSDFVKKLEKGQGEYSKLKQVVSPFVLRRLKTDKSIITDLPEKIEMKTYATLSKKQTLLYNKLVKELSNKIQTEEGIKRKGLVLAAIMKFKQICNHPDQYLGQKSYLEKESGKFERLREICENIYEKRERVIVFTQFREITEYLNTFMESIFKHKGLILHGGTPVKKRKELVDKFQGNEYVPFMVLSIKAGGVGLNLTSANHVIHFDRWWNPAVENQATDRAFRIGQMKNVVVHKFIMRGTIEEKIDLMIEDKSSLADEIISDNQESHITEMDNEQLMDLFKL